MRLRNVLIAMVLISIIIGTYLLFRKLGEGRIEREIEAYSGTESCRPCHEKFYQLWAPSHHGTAMQDVTSEFLNREIKSNSENIPVGQSLFNVVESGDKLKFTEILSDGQSNEYFAIHALGGKYIYYFLTEFERGRLHVLPIAYDCKTDTWYNNPESGVRHFEAEEDGALDWKSHLYTFNTSCYGCHVSQFESNFDLDNLTYETTWSEPGINCETCHGPSAEHIRVIVEAGENNIPEDIKIIMTSTFTPEQHDASCGSCHAKSSVVAPDYPPGENFYDYFSLITLENQDYYADGRDLGENYTMTNWAMNKCQLSSDIHCVSCHTSSGRYIFADNNPNNACAPCHTTNINNVEAHSNHKEGSEGAICIACHMPKTTFARMDRSDHSFRPPMPEATIAFGSPNACNICHKDKSPEWANREIKKTHSREYQKETLASGNLILEAREGNWKNLDEIIDGLAAMKFDEVYSTSFIRLLNNCNDNRKWEGILANAGNASPLVRSAVAQSLAFNTSTESYTQLINFASDSSRSVRIRAAYSLSSLAASYPDYNSNQSVGDAISEYVKSELSRPDSWSSHYNLGNYYGNIGNYPAAIVSYNNAVRVYPEAIMAMINVGFLYSVTGDNKEAEAMFERALSFEPDHEAALLNLALLYGETGRNDLAITYFRRLLEVSDKNAVAAFNLSIYLSETDPDESLQLIKKAYSWDTENSKYVYTYAFYLNKAGDSIEARNKLNKLIVSDPDYIDAYLLLSDIYLNESNASDARKVLNIALSNDNFNSEQKQGILTLLKDIL